MKRLLALTAALVVLISVVHAVETSAVLVAKASEKVCDAKCKDAKCAGKKCEGAKCAGNKCAGNKCAGKKCTGAKCGDGCPIQAAMQALPKFTFQVGDEKTCCSEAAAKLAKELDAPVHFVLGDKTFETKNVAMVALADATENYVKAFATPKTCSSSGKTTVAGKELCCDVMAGERANLAKEAMAKISMTYLVGKKECDCPNQAASLAKTSGDEKFFVVGKEKTCCSTSARLNLARAKFRAAVEALAKADAVSDTDKS